MKNIITHRYGWFDAYREDEMNMLLGSNQPIPNRLPRHATCRPPFLPLACISHRLPIDFQLIPARGQRLPLLILTDSDYLLFKTDQNGYNGLTGSAR